MEHFRYSREYKEAMCVIGPVLEMEEWSELKEKMKTLQDASQFLLTLDAYVHACSELIRADKAFALVAEKFSEDGNWNDTDTILPKDYWSEFRRLEMEYDITREHERDVYNELLDWIRNVD